MTDQSGRTPSPEKGPSSLDGYTPITIPYHVLRDLLAYGWTPEGEGQAWAYRRARESALEAVEAARKGSGT